MFHLYSLDSLFTLIGAIDNTKGKNSKEVKQPCCITEAQFLMET